MRVNIMRARKYRSSSARAKIVLFMHFRRGQYRRFIGIKIAMKALTAKVNACQSSSTQHHQIAEMRCRKEIKPSASRPGIEEKWPVKSEAAVLRKRSERAVFRSRYARNRRKIKPVYKETRHSCVVYQAIEMSSYQCNSSSGGI